MSAFVRMCCLLVAAIVLAGCASPNVVSTRSLLAEMTDLQTLAEFPEPPFTCRQFSSYDREAKSPSENWFANADRGQYLRVEENAGRTEYVMMDANGPGAIVRIWSANPAGTLRVYIDGNQAPAIEAPMDEFLGGKLPGIPAPIAGQRSRGWNSYFPIAYARHCKVTSDAGDFYYHVNYRTYPADTPVVSFEPSDLELLAGQVDDVAAALASPREAGATVEGSALPVEIPDEEGLLVPGGELFIRFRQGPGAIVALKARVEAEKVDQVLRQLVLDISFDGQHTVACPLGDFFGAAPGINPYDSLPMGVTEDGELWCHWVMPFEESAEIAVRNRSDESVRVELETRAVKYEWTDRSMHFNAKWRTEFDVPTRPMQDWNYLRASGRGVFVGAAFTIANPVRNWWGEGDEKIYVDGETFPSHFGTGTEDYYGYAWCSNEPFVHAYHNQPRCDGPGNYGHTAVNRWHIIDRIPYERDYRFDMELWHWTEDCDVTMSVVSYWYARPGGADQFAPLKPAELRLVALPEYVAPRVEGAIEGEEMRLIGQTATVAPQAIRACSNEQHMWWHNGVTPGDRLTLGFDVAQAGRYRVLARFVKARDYGIARLSINDLAAGDPIDFYNDGIVTTDEIDLGEFDLPQGESQITAEIVGVNASAVKSYLFGLDYVRLEPAP